MKNEWHGSSRAGSTLKPRPTFFVSCLPSYLIRMNRKTGFEKQAVKQKEIAMSENIEAAQQGWTDADAERIGKLCEKPDGWTDSEIMDCIQAIQFVEGFLRARGKSWSLAANPLRQELYRFESIMDARGRRAERARTRPENQGKK